ncbi:MAG TPA: tetratricopeptide repeat protein [Methylothermaceae bacterium]|nr:tetratricopeptide repeat protein [Methylothermaceae bacterium]
MSGCAKRSAFPEPPPLLSEEKLRKLEVTGDSVKSDILYVLLTAEIAGQRGQYRLALDNYLQVADKIPEPWVAERAARIALYLNDVEKAKKAVELWLSRDPDSLDANKAAVMLYLQSGENEKAIDRLAHLMTLAGANKEQVLLEILRFMDKKVPKPQSLAVMEALSQRFPRSPEVHYAFGLLALRQGNTDLALKHVTKALELRPDWNKVQLMQSHLLAQLGESDKARHSLKALIEKHPENIQLRMVYAQFLLKQQDYKAAEQEFNKILRLQPDHPDALYAYALVSLQLHKDKQAEKALKLLLQQPKWRSEAYFYLGRIEAKRGNYQKALEWFEKIKEGDLVFDAEVNSTAALVKLGKVEEALKRLEKLQTQYPEKKRQLYLLQAEILNEQKDYQGAFEVLSRALIDFPGDSDLLYARALLAEKLDRLDIVEADLKKILEKNPDDANALNALGYTLVDRTNRYEEAKSFLDKALRLKPDDPAILDSYGWLLYKLKDYSGALHYLQKAYQINPDPEIGAHLGEVLWALERRDEAKQLWREVIKKTKKGDRIRELVERFKQRLEE